MSLPSSTTAVISHGHSATLESSWPLQSPLPASYLLVKVDSVALNPTDWKHLQYGLSGPAPVVVGCDYAGTVVAIGSGVTKALKPGDRIAGCGHGSNQTQPWTGVFAQYAIVKGDLAIRIPDSLPFEKAATLPLGSATVGQGLYQKALQLRLPSTSTSTTTESQGEEGQGEGEWVLIYGGSTATGSLGIQYAKASGYRVVTTSSPRHFDFVLKEAGADAVFDYHDAAVGQKINQLTGNTLRLVWDTVSLPASAAICSAALTTDERVPDLRYGSVLPIKLPEPQPNQRKVTQTLTFMYTIFNEPFAKAGGMQAPAVPEDFEFAKRFVELTERLLAEGKVKPHPEKVGADGLKGVLQGLKDLQEGRVSGQKLVYRVGDTPEQAVGASADFQVSI